ncbi:hypothetical protein A8L34_16790 [Bacillus sp. FJAT-27264]|uniref:hypothetical protein n=1 Tax=Paenibacillus sp. (strain DSM 101736 / FJAT-27264) TaxID=1850362 RepID=UPI000807E7B9|nr:hypothetical protein [Bacillus sp. FJAT-27264]OBZ11970.1 hypothetical protein A8L34_16790 [Bacillus sp. FJAT-27264]
MRQKRLFPATAAAAVLLMALTACSGNNSAQPADNSATPVPTVTPAESNEPTPSPSAEADAIKGTGIYNGQIDNHSVEIETKDGATSFELGLGTENVPETLNEGDSVVFEYVERTVGGDESVKQHILLKLSLANTGG